MRDALITPLPVDGRAPHANRRNDTEWWSEEASLCNNGLFFFLCGGLHNYESHQDCMPPQKRNWLVKQKDLALLISTLTTSDHVLWVCWHIVYTVVAGWFFSTATNIVNSLTMVTSYQHYKLILAIVEFKLNYSCMHGQHQHPMH